MTKRKRPGPRMTRRQSRERAEQAMISRARGHTWQECADRWGFSSRGACEQAVRRELARTSPESPGDARRYLLESARATSRRWSEEFESAYEARDCERMFAAHTALVKDRVEIAKLTGAYSPAEVRVGVSAEEFARDAAELIKVLGAETSMRILADAPGVAAALEPALA